MKLIYDKLRSRSADWRILAYDLGFNQNDTKRIQEENSDVEVRLRAVCAEWVKRNPKGSLRDVDKALKKHRDNDEALNFGAPEKRRGGQFCCYMYIVLISLVLLSIATIYLQNVLHPSKAVVSPDIHQPSTPQPPPKYKLRKYNIPINGTVTDSLKLFEEDFWYLLAHIQVVLNKDIAIDKEKMEHLGRYLSNCFNVSYRPVSDQQGIDQIDLIFRGIKHLFNFMDTSLLKDLDKRFLNRTFSSKLADYDKSLDQFLRSTRITRLVHQVWTAKKEDNKIFEIVLELGHNWNDKNLKNLQKFIEHVFGADASLMRLISIHHSILTVIYELPMSLYLSVFSKFVNSQPLFQMADILGGFIGGNYFVFNRTRMLNDTTEVLFDILSAEDEHFYISYFQFLVDIGADVNYIHSSLGLTPLMVAIELGKQEAITTLLNLNADPMIYNLEGYTSLHKCIILGYVECVKLHLELGVDPNTRTKDEFGMTPLLLATYNRQVEIMKALLRKNAKVNTCSCSKWLFPYIFPTRAHLQPFFLINMLHCNGLSPLVQSVCQGRIDLVNLLLEHGADPNSCFGMSSVLDMAITSQRFGIVKALLKHNASVNGLYGMTTPLMSAFLLDVLDDFGEHEYVKLFEILLNHGADINILNDEFVSATPLMIAVVYGKVRMVELLLIKGTSVTEIIKNGITATDLVNYQLRKNFGYSLKDIEISRRYLTIKNLLSFYEKKQQLSQNDPEKFLHLETKYTRSNSSIYELVYEAKYVLKNDSISHIGPIVDTLRSLVLDKYLPDTILKSFLSV